jgi:chromosome segregation ATPase
MKKIAIGFIILFTIAACNDKEKKEKALTDLDATQQTLSDIHTRITELETTMIKMAGELEVVKDDINQAKEFQMLRTEAEREQQIRNATEHRIKIEENIENLKSQILYFKDSVDRTKIKIGMLKDFLKN